MKKYIFSSLIFLLVGCGSSPTPSTTPKTTTGAGTTQNTGQALTATPTPTPSPTPVLKSFIQGSLDGGFAISSNTAGTMIKYDNILADRSSEYDKNTGIFAPKKPGFYFVQAQYGLPVPATGWDTGHYCQLWISKSDGSISGVGGSSMTKGSTIPCVASVNAVVALMQGQSISLGAIAVPSGTTIKVSNSPYSRLTITWMGE